MPIIELPEFATSQGNENEPTDSLKSTGYATEDQPPSSVQNWLDRTTYDSLRGTLARTIAGSAAQGFAPGATSWGGASAELAVDPASGIILVGSDSGNIQVYSSTDGGFTATKDLDVVATPILDIIAIVPGEYALAMTLSSFYYAAYPYTSWTLVAKTFSPGNFVDYAIADVAGLGAVLMCLTDDGIIWYTDATVMPTVGGDWTSVDVSSVVGAVCRVIAASGTSVVIGSNTGVFEAATADGIAAGDFGAVAGPADCDGLDFNGEVFAAVDGSASEIYTSPSADASGAWTTSTATLGIDDVTNITGIQSHIWGDPVTGLFLLTTLNSTTESVFISSDGKFWHQVFSSTGDIIALGTGSAVKILPGSYKIVALAAATKLAVSL